MYIYRNCALNADGYRLVFTQSRQNLMDIPVENEQA